MLFFVLLLYNSSFSQCAASVTISGVYTTLYTGSNTWIASSGTTTIPSGADVTLDANPVTNGYVLLNPGFETQTNANFLAIVVTPCSLLTNETFVAPKLVSVYPNPVVSILNIESSLIITTIAITDLNGRIVFEKVNNNTSTFIDTNMLSSGMYLLKATTSKGVFVDKIVKK